MYFCLFLLLLLVSSEITARLVKSLSSPLVQIGLGAIAGLIVPDFNINFNPVLFLLLFIPPLLFSDSWHWLFTKLVMPHHSTSSLFCFSSSTSWSYLFIMALGQISRNNEHAQLLCAKVEVMY